MPMLSNKYCSERILIVFKSCQAKKKVVKIFLLPTLPHKSNVYENIYFLFQKNTHTNNKFPAANLLVRIYVFSLQTIKDKALCFSKKEKYC